MFNYYKNKRRLKRMERFFASKAVAAELLYQHYAWHNTSLGIGNDLNDEIIVSLTSFDQRIDSVYLVVESLFHQAVKADRIILWLSLKNFPNGEDDLPLMLKRQQSRGLDIRFVKDDIGPYKKIIYSAQNYPQSLIITVDDDVLYPLDLIEKFYQAYLRSPDVIHCNRAHLISFDKRGRILPYKIWHKPTEHTASGFAVFPTGNSGVLYFPGCLASEVNDQDAFMRLAPNADDIWLKAMSLKNDIKCQVIPDRRELRSRFLNIQGSKARSLKSMNKSKNGGNDEKLKAVFDHYQLWEKF